VDVARKRIGLSMKTTSSAPRQETKRPQQPAPGKPRQAPVEANNPFQAKLMELKKKFKD
jgi:predicted RNA-binding protein with RPS1 domain